MLHIVIYLPILYNEAKQKRHHHEHSEMVALAQGCG